MTDLQLYSLIGGGTIVAAVYAFNWWQEYRYRKNSERSFARNQPDVLLDTPKNMVRSTGETRRLEPMLDDARPASERLEPALAAASAEPEHEIVGEDDIPDLPAGFRIAVEPEIPESTVAPAPAPEESDVLATSLLDPALDFVAEIYAEDNPIDAAAVPPFPGAKRVVVIGCDEQRRWDVVVPRSDARYTQLRVALQLADRQGALSQEQLNAFCMGVQQFCDAHQADAVFPQRSPKLAEARDLDQFCAEVDVLIGLNIMARGKPLPMAKVRTLAENAGLSRGPDGNFQYRSESGKVLFTMGNHDESPLGMTSDGLTLFFDVPRVAGGIAVFDYLTDFAQGMAAALEANLVDDSGKPLSEASIANIRKQLGGIYARMDDKGIAAGSMAALRLFA
jgi:hypothetical protein